jgi:hypothetical protein
MALVKLESAVTYRSQVGQSNYTFVVQVTNNGLVAVRDIRGPNGLVQDPFTTLPSTVIDDIYAAKGATTALLAETSVTSGSTAFTGQTTLPVVLSPDLDSTAYRVALTFSPIGPTGYVTNQTTGGFDIVLSSAYTGTVGWTVLQKASSTSNYCGTVTFTSSASELNVSFTTAAASADYRVVLTPDGFYPVGIKSQTTTGFTIQLGIGLFGPQTANVGFDVFF